MFTFILLSLFEFRFNLIYDYGGTEDALVLCRCPSLHPLFPFSSSHPPLAPLLWCNSDARRPHHNQWLYRAQPAVWSPHGHFTITREETLLPSADGLQLTAPMATGEEPLLPPHLLEALVAIAGTMAGGRPGLRLLLTQHWPAAPAAAAEASPTAVPWPMSVPRPATYRSTAPTATAPACNS